MQHVLGKNSAWSGQPVQPAKRLAQAAGVTCEPTPEGGLRCSDGTYHPPGCQKGDPATTIQGSPSAAPIWPYIAAAGVIAAGAAIALSGRRSMGIVPTLENSYPAVAADLRALAGKINGERAADSWNFSQMQEAVKNRLSLLSAAKGAEERLKNEEMIWEKTHRNADTLQAATAEVERLVSEISAALAKADEYRGYVTANAAAVVRYRTEADSIIAGLPAEFQTDARIVIDPCYKPAKMGGGGFLGQVGLRTV